MKQFKYIYIVGLMLVLASCVKDRDVILTRIVVKESVISASSTQATVSCKLDCNNVDPFVLYANNSGFSEAKTAILETKDGTNYFANLTDLQLNTTYYVRYYIWNGNQYLRADKQDQFYTKNITINGDFTDWDQVIANGTAVYTELTDGVEYVYTAIKKFAAYMDADYIYFFLEADATQNTVMPLDLYLGCSGELVDADPCTSQWNPMYCDYLVEFGKGDTFVSDVSQMDWYDWSYNTLFAYDHKAGGWSFSQLATNICTVSNKVTDGSVFRIEGKMNRANFTMKVSYVYICCCTSNSGWGYSGLAPAAPIEGGTAKYQSQLKLYQDK